MHLLFRHDEQTASTCGSLHLAPTHRSSRVTYFSNKTHLGQPYFLFLNQNYLKFHFCIKQSKYTFSRSTLPVAACDLLNHLCHRQFSKSHIFLSMFHCCSTFRSHQRNATSQLLLPRKKLNFTLLDASFARNVKFIIKKQILLPLK